MRYLDAIVSMILAWPFDLRDAPDEAMVMANDTFGDAFPGLRSMAELAITGPCDPIEFEFGLPCCLTEWSGDSQGAPDRPSRLA